MKFSPCTNNCTSGGNYCQGCGRSHQEIRETKAIGATLVAHLFKYGYDDPENFLDVLCTKSLNRLAALKEEKRK
ncbi:DUF1289 domain-containing protein [Psychromonas sp. MME2]|uniref:DUF1289 domain-containing protein n=1 Tax=unclassified Psychromonas TaxID=2614957 RepID=UPI00339C4B5E